MGLAEYPAEVRFLWVRSATERLLISFYAFGGWDRVKCDHQSTGLRFLCFGGSSDPNL